MSTRAPAAGSVPATAAGVRRILANGVSLLFAYILPRGATFIAAVVAARALGAEGFGLYGTAAAYAVILSIVATFGLMPLLVREMAREPEQAGALLHAAHRLKSAANVLMLALLIALAAGPLGYPDTVLAAAVLLGVSYAIGAYVENLAAYFQAVERMHVWTAGSAVYGAVTGVAGVIAVIATRDVVWFAAAPVVGQLASLLWLRRRLPIEARRPARATSGGALRLARAAAPFAAAFVALTVYSKVDVLLLAAWRSASDVGVYVAPYKFVDLTRALAIVAAAAVYPRLARAAGGPRGAAASRVGELLLLASVPLAAVLWLARTPVIGILFGDDYAGAVPVLALLAPALVPLAFDIFAGYALAATDRMRDVAFAYLAALVVNVMLNVLLVPRAGAVGAAGAMLASESALALALAALMRVRMHAGPRVSTLLVAAGAATACPLLSVVVGDVTMATALYLTVVIVLYWRAGVLPTQERALLRAALRARA